MNCQLNSGLLDPIHANIECNCAECVSERADEAEEMAVVENMIRRGECLACGRPNKEGHHLAGCPMRHHAPIVHAGVHTMYCQCPRCAAETR